MTTKPMTTTNPNASQDEKKWLQPLPGRLFSVAVAIGCVALLWTSVLNHQAPSHGVATLLLITSALSSFHAFGWRPKYVLERWVLSPVGSCVLLLLTATLHFS